MTKKITTPKTKEVIKEKKVFYAVNNRGDNVVDQDELWIYPTLEEAYASHIEDCGTEETCYAYKIEYMGEVSMQITIKN